MDKRRLSAAFVRLRKNRKLIETGKSVLIVLLVCSAMLLGAAAGLFPGVARLGSALAGSSGAAAESTDYASAADPFCVVVTPEAGTHCAVLYDGEKTAEAYARFSSSFAEAMGSSQTPERVSAEEWQAALSGPGVYFDFVSDQYIPVLAGWLGTDVTSGAALHMARRFCLAKDGDSVALYYYRVRSETGPYRCATALSWSDISERVEAYLPNGAQFNFELQDGYESVDPFAVLLPDTVQIRAAEAANPLRGESADDALLSAFGMSSAVVARYSEADGTQVCMEGDATLRLSTSGTLDYSDAGTGGAETTDARTVEIVRSLCEATVGARCGDAALYLSYIYRDLETDVYTLCFDYRLNGLPVRLSDGGNAARVTVSGGRVLSAELRFRSFALQDAAETPLPPRLAFAAAQASGGGEPLLCYDEGADGLTVCWTIR